MERQTIYTVTAHCQDCYRCVRACPVKAISVRQGQAKVEDALCIKCGSCVRECPQGAKIIRSDLAEVKKAVSEAAVVASVAPSFAAIYGGNVASRLPSALRLLGFKHVSETAEGAKYITEKSFASDCSGSICTACPAVVNYVEMYAPKLIDELKPVSSPMVAHGRLLKERHPDCKVVFIGPCAAKKDEIKRKENAGAVDYVITFQELKQWLDDEEIRTENCSESIFENEGDIGYARLFPLQGGMLKTGGIPDGAGEAGILHISGAKAVMTLFSDIDAASGYTSVEPLFCYGGCVGGPDFKEESSFYARLSKIINYAEEQTRRESANKRAEVNFAGAFDDRSGDELKITERQINAVFEKMGKSDPASRLDCGICGYSSCLEQARAVIRDMAEIDMCIPYMRRLAKQSNDRIIETSPNGVVILDSNLNMITMNPAFQKMFMCNNGLLGRNISYLVNAGNFELLLKNEGDLFESIRTKYGMRYHEIAYALRDEGQYVGIYSNITNIKLDDRQMEGIKAQTLIHAKEFLEHQVRFAQEMAHYLGKSTAQSEEIARRLISLYEEEGGGE